MTSEPMDAFIELLSKKPDGEFVAKPFYEPHMDSIIYYRRHVQSYAKRIDEYLTMFLAEEDDSLVGVELHGVQRIIGEHVKEVSDDE